MITLDNQTPLELQYYVHADVGYPEPTGILASRSEKTIKGPGETHAFFKIAFGFDLENKPPLAQILNVHDQHRITLTVSTDQKLLATAIPI